MMNKLVQGIYCLALVSLLVQGVLGAATRREDDVDPRLYKAQHSFRAPFFIGRGGIPFWEFGGSAMITDEAVRLTDAQQSRKGWIWNSQTVDAADWEVITEISVGSQGRKGADGMAFWYTKDKSETEGPVYGAKDHWTGLGVFLDTFDNDNKRDNPSIRAMINDGTRSYDHDNDGIGGSLGAGCGPVEYRNVAGPIKIKISYIDGVLAVDYDLGYSGGYEEKWTSCVKIPATLPKHYHFGISAATGGLYDQHDVKSFITYSFGEVDAQYQQEQDSLQRQLEKHQEQNNNNQNNQQQQQQQQAATTTNTDVSALKQQLLDLENELKAAKEKAQREAYLAAQQEQGQQAAQQQLHQQQAAQQLNNNNNNNNQQNQQQQQQQNNQQQNNNQGDNNAELIAIKAKVLTLEVLLHKQTDAILAANNALDHLQQTIGNLATKNDVSGISISANAAGGTSQLANSIAQLKDEISIIRRGSEGDQNGLKSSMLNLQQHVTPVKSILDQLSTSLNALRSEIRSIGGNGGNGSGAVESGGFGSWIIFIVLQIIILGGVGMWIRSKAKRDRYLN